MSLPKQNLPIPFGIGLDTKTDPWQVAAGNMLGLTNVIFDKTKQLVKSYGYAKLTSLPSGANVTTITTFGGNLTALGSQLYSYSSESNQWLARGRYQNVSLSVAPIVRNSYSQSNQDVATASSGLACVVYLDGDGSYKYVVSDAPTGQTLLTPTKLPTGATQPRVFTLGNYFVITFLITVSSTPHLQYIAIPQVNLTNPGSATDISAQVSSTSAGYDGVVANNTLFVAWDGSDSGGAIRFTSLNSSLVQGTTIATASYKMALGSLCADTSGTTPVVWVSAWNSTSKFIYSLAFNQLGSVVLAPTQTLSSATNVVNLTSTANNGVLSLYYQTSNTYNYNSVRSDFISVNTCTQAGVVGTAAIVKRSVALASKAFSFGGVTYFLAAYGGSYQPTYFLIDGSGNVVGKLAYSNGGGYPAGQVLSSAPLTGNVARIAYLFKDLVQAVNKTQGLTNNAGIYSQVGINLASFDLMGRTVSTAELGSNLNIAGGFLWAFDGTNLVEQNFHLWPENVVVTTTTTGGSITAQTYYYQAVYEWTDAQGNIHRSAPSVPVSITTTGSTSTNTINIPTLRLTYKTNVRVTLYRWSTAQQSYYQVTSITSPLLNDPTVDQVTFSDTQADSSILGNSLIYTTGGVVEDVGGPACTALTIFKTRLVLIDAEDRNLLWFSKQAVEGAPVEMSDLLTIYVPPSVGAQGTTGPCATLAPMDDKLIIGKQSAFNYITGTGPDNTGANSDFSDATYIASTVGCANQQSLVLTPAGLLAQSDKGIWLLGRGLNTVYQGAPVEKYNTQTITSALAIPGTNRVQFTLGVVSACLYQSLHTYVTSTGDVYQQTPGLYLDASNGGVDLIYDYYMNQWGTILHQGPVLIGFDTAWFNLAGVQGLQRAYFFQFIGQYLSPHKLSISIAYNYNPSPNQSTVISPSNYASTFGSDNQFGQSQVYGGASNIEDGRVFFDQQKVTAFQLQVREVFDPTYGTAPGAGLTLSGLNLVYGAKKAYRNTSAAKSTG